MNMHRTTIVKQYEAIPICPQCGCGDGEDNRIDEQLYIEAAKEAPRLRFEGRVDEALEILTALYAIRIANFLRPDMRCPVCGVSYDG